MPFGFARNMDSSSHQSHLELRFATDESFEKLMQLPKDGGITALCLDTQQSVWYHSLFYRYGFGETKITNHFVCGHPEKIGRRFKAMTVLNHSGTVFRRDQG